MIAAPALAAQAPVRLVLSPADTDRNGVVSQDETAAYLVRTSGPSGVQVLRPRAAVLELPPGPPEPDALSLERRLVPASDFEVANDYQARKTERKRRH